MEPLHIVSQKFSSKPKSENKNYREIICQLAAGATAPIPKQTVVAPLDRTKIYFQTHKENYR